MSRDGGWWWSNYHLKVVSKTRQNGEILRKSAKKGEKMKFVLKFNTENTKVSM